MRKPKLLNQRNLTLLALIIAGEAIFFLPFALARIFRPTLLVVFDITNTELGTFFSIYGIVAMVSYFFGGPLADRFPAKYLLSIALWLTGLGGFVMSSIPTQRTMIFLYGFWGLTTILLFWAALIRATRQWGGTDFQGRAFGWLEGGRGATAALLGTLSLLVFSNFNPESSTMAGISELRISSFKNVILVTSAMTMFSGALVWWFVPVNNDHVSSDTIKLNQIGRLLKLSSVWLLSIIIICAYVGYKITDDFSLYANEVLGYNELNSAGIGTIALWMRAVVAILAGYLADKVSSSKIISISFGLAIIGSGLIATGLIEQIVIIVILNLALVMIGVYAVRALYFALIQEAKIPIYLTGTVVGIISVLGFTPDIFMSPWMGHLLDSNPGPQGHRNVFLVLCSFSVLGFNLSLLFASLSKEE